MPPFINRKRERSPSAADEPPPKKRKAAAETPVAARSEDKKSRKKKKYLLPARQVANAKSKRVSIFDSIDNVHGPGTVSTKLFPGSLDTDTADDLSSEPDSDEFEDVVEQRTGAGREDSDELDESDEAEEEWEDAVHHPSHEETVHAPAKALELNLGGSRTAEVSYSDITGGKKQGPSKKDKATRILAHCAHVQFLLWHNHIRNHWLNDEEVQNIMVNHMKQSQKLNTQFESWKRKSGAETVESPTKPLSASAKGSGKGKGRRSAKQDPRKERDWGRPAERQAIGEPDLSRGDPLQQLLGTLAAWWKQRFTITAPGLRKRGYKEVRDLKEDIQAWRKGESVIKDHGERIATLQEFRAHAKRCEGSRDVGAQLFVALLRGLSIEARMVGSLQPLGYGWTKSERAEPKPKKPLTDSTTEEKTTSSDRVPPKTKKTFRKATGSKADAIALSDTSDLSELPDADQEDDDESDASIIDITPKRRPNKPYDRDLLFPHYWIEAVSTLTNRVFPVDPFVIPSPVATNAEGLMMFEPRGVKAEKAHQVFAYVIAHSADHSAKDVTVRYLKQHIWPGKTKGVRLASARIPIRNQHGKIRGYYEIDWWQTVIQPYLRPDSKRTLIDDIEEQGDLKPRQPEKKAPKEGIPDTLDGFKKSAEYVLARHLRREEALLPGANSVQTFKSGKGSKETEDSVYLRKDVATCRTAESWHKEGRQVKVGEQPLKRVPYRAVTTTRKREVEEIERETGEKAMQGMYTKDQTEWIIPPPIKDGVIPKNAYGNMDAFVPQMIPKGAVHLRIRGAVKVCKKLEIDFAEAVTGFEFGNRMAVPVIEGVVVAVDNRDLVINAWKKAEEERKIKEAAKQEKLVLATWRKFLMGLRIIERMKDEYEVGVDDDEREEVNPFMNKNRKSAATTGAEPSHQQDQSLLLPDNREAASDLVAEDPDMAGGFLPEGYEEESTTNGDPARHAESQHANKELSVEYEVEEASGSRLDKRPKMRSLAEVAAQRVATKDEERATIESDDNLPEVSEPETKANNWPITKKQKATPRRKPQKAHVEDDHLSEPYESDNSSEIEVTKPATSTQSRGARASARSAAKANKEKVLSHFFKSDSAADEEKEDLTVDTPTATKMKGKGKRRR